MELRKAITINRPLEEIYSFWRDFSNLPRFMTHLQAVHVIDSTHSHWETQSPLGKDKTIEWDAEIVEEKPNELIAWRSLPGADVPNSGSVRFTRAPGNRGTELHVEIGYEVPGGVVRNLVAKVLGEDPERQVYDDLRALKQILETGEILYSDSSIHGRPHAATTVGQPDAPQS